MARAWPIAGRAVLATVFVLADASAVAQALKTEGVAPAVPSQFTTSDGAYFVRSSQRQGLIVLDRGADEGPTGKGSVVARQRTDETALAVALAQAWKRDFIEQGVEETRNVLLECQRETSVVLTTPLMRSNAQRDHCFRF